MEVLTVDLKAASTRVANSLSNLPITGKHVSLSGPKALSAKDSSTTSTSDPSSDITSNDFLTLLVTEMKNQDPTQPTDPNAYIQQLVGVNSLQQLISINQELGAVTAPSTGGASAPSSTADGQHATGISAVDNL